MKKSFLIAIITFGLSSACVNAASTFDVDEFNRATEFGNSAVKSKNYDRAFKYLTIASELGNKVSQFTLALLYMEGLGVEQDYAQAYVWLNVASEVNEKKWRKVRDKLHNALTEEQIAALTPRVNEYIEKYGAKTQEVSCYKRASIGSNRKIMQCSKYLTPGR